VTEYADTELMRAVLGEPPNHTGRPLGSEA
jgi:hypothetical protein